MSSAYPPLNLAVRTPRLTLAAATDDLLERLVPVVRTGVVTDDEPAPFDDPMSLYEDSPAREWRWLRAIWSGRSRVSAEFWRLYFVVCDDGEPVGMQDPQRHDLGHPSRRGRRAAALAVDPGRMGAAAAHRYRAVRR